MTMTVDAIENNNGRRTVLLPMAQGALIGGGIGAASKYILPLTQEEKTTDEYIKVRNRVNAEKTQYNFRTQKFVDSLKAKLDKTPADDEFIKMFNGMTDGSNVKRSSIKNALANLAGNEAETLKFKKLCKETSDIANQTAAQFMKAYNLITKHIRPMSFFLTSGAVVGALIAMLNTVLKTEVKS